MLYDYALPQHITSLKETLYGQTRTKGYLNNGSSGASSPSIKNKRSSVEYVKSQQMMASLTLQKFRSSHIELPTQDESAKLKSFGTRNPSLFQTVDRQSILTQFNENNIKSSLLDTNNKTNTKSLKQSFTSQNLLGKPYAGKQKITATAFSVKHPNLIMHPKSLRHTFKFETVSNIKPGKALQQPAVINVNLEQLSAVNIVQEKKNYQRYIKNKLKEFLKDYR
ncbi:UNKNOWN [Stylonychia lemnae]|uniref:Uncharacterized protein n=1 Tax=Stylonychia lemnae TaxID=5949 RepID=A0A078AP05_STYLE|nr:UNKNOWN [Stylonychia lemnae]|eukprot:CDW84100.1 UNKNOWN [Stylonychia lemnae]